MSVDPEIALDHARKTAHGARNLRMQITPIPVDELLAIVELVDGARARDAEQARAREYRRQRAARRFDSMLDQRRTLTSKLEESRALVDEILGHFSRSSSSNGPCLRTGLLPAHVIEDWRERAQKTAPHYTDTEST